MKIIELIYGLCGLKEAEMKIIEVKYKSLNKQQYDT